MRRGGPVRTVAEIASFHAHVYFAGDEEARAARRLRDGVAERFAVRLGTWWDRPVGPHARSMFQIAFEPGLFGSIVPWLMLNREGLSILVHPNTADQRRDHVDDSLWIGPPLQIDESVLPDEVTEAEVAGEANTAPSVQP